MPPSPAVEAAAFSFVAPTENVDAYLALELDASAPYAEYVYASMESARRVHRRLLEAGVGEFAGPFGELALDATGAPVGMIAGPLDAKELGGARFRAAGLLRKDPDIAADAGFREYAATVRAALFPVADGDAYLSRIAVADTARGRGVGSALLTHFLERARARGARRAVLEVSPRHDAAFAMYVRAGFSQVGEGTARALGRELVYRHLALGL